MTTESTDTKAVTAKSRAMHQIVHSPIHGKPLGTITLATDQDVDEAVDLAQEAFEAWRSVPAPKRGELIRHFGDVLREHKQDLGELITLESGKILQEGLGEVQEMIDICEFAVGLSRQLYGLTIASERPDHRMMEQWHPLGPIAVISAFNFPGAVWAWNFAIAIVCGDTVIWKPSPLGGRTAEICQDLFQAACTRCSFPVPHGLSQIVHGEADIGNRLVTSPKVRLVSATGSSRMGREIKAATANDLGKRVLLELGGNNAMIVAPSADLALATRAIVFSAVGTAGQRCTTLRRLFVHESIWDALMPKVVSAYANVVVGDPRKPKNLVGPLRTEAAYLAFSQAISEALKDPQARMLVGGGRIQGLRGIPKEGTFYVVPAVVEMTKQTTGMLEETFAPLLYAMRYSTLDEAIALNNAAHHGLSSSIFTNDVREAERFLSAAGSDCGIANVNIGPSGAEIGGAFGGEKDTGGGRESGSDSWKAYMRRTTNTVNYGTTLPLAQGITFDTD